MAYWISTSGNRYYNEPGDQASPSIIQLRDGRQVIGWLDEAYTPGAPIATLMARITAADGGADGQALVLGDSITNGTLATLRLVATADGGFDAFWNETTPATRASAPYTTYAGRHFDANGVPTGDRFALMAQPEVGMDLHFKAVALASGNVLVAWLDGGYRPTFRIVTPEGVPVTEARSIEPRVQPGDDFAHTMDIAAAPDGGFFVAWNLTDAAQMDHAYFQKFDASGAAQGGAHLAINFDAIVSTEIAALADGNAVVTVVDYLTDSQQYEIFGGEFTAAGAIAGWHAEQLTRPASTNVYQHDVTALPDGGFTITWAEKAPGTENGKLWMQRYDSGFERVDQPTHAFVGDMGAGVTFATTARQDGGVSFAYTWQTGSGGGDIHALTYLNEPVAGATVQGTAGNDRLQGSTGDDTVDGGGGIDTMDYPTVLANYALSRTADAFTVMGYDGNFMQTDWLRHVERLHFTDVNVALDVDGHAGQAYRLYQAAFDRGPDLGGLGFHIADLDRGVPLAVTAEHFLESPEFQSRYGNLDDDAFVTRLYANILHRSPDASGKAYHLHDLESGVSRAWVLVHFSESPENQAALVGVIENGMPYIPQ